MFQITTESRPASIHQDNALYPLGTVVFIDTLCCGPQQKGFVSAYVPNPFYGQSGLCAYIIGEGWTDYIPATELGRYVASDCTDCGGHFHESQMCPECGHCLGCCDCPPSPLDDDDYPDYMFDSGEDYAYDDWKDTRALHRWAYGG